VIDDADVHDAGAQLFSLFLSELDRITHHHNNLIENIMMGVSAPYVAGEPVANKDENDINRKEN
jgi:hypothetical protein